VLDAIGINDANAVSGFIQSGGHTEVIDAGVLAASTDGFLRVFGKEVKQALPACGVVINFQPGFEVVY